MPKAVIAAGGVDRDLLAQIVTATKAGSFVYTSPTAHQPMLANVPPLVEVNTSMTDPNDATKFATRATQDAEAFLATPAPAAAGNAQAASASPSSYQILTGVALPEPKKRGNTFGNGAPTKYPFADMPVGGAFFSANTEHKNKDAVKALGSTVSSQNRKYATPEKNEDGTEKTKTQKRAKRDDKNKAILDANGKKIIETVTLPVLKYERKFTIRAVEAGKKYGEWTAPADGALIARTV